MRMRFGQKAVEGSGSVSGRLGSAVREALLASLVTVALALPLAGFELRDVGGRMTAQARPSWVLAAALLVFAGRFCLAWWNVGVGRPPRGPATPRVVAVDKVRILSWAMAAFVIAALLLPVSPVASRYTVDLATTFLIYVMLGWGLNIVVGLAGLLDLGYVAFYAAGAYTFALLANYAGVGFWVALPLAGLTAALLGILLGFPVLRLRGDYLAIVTLGFGEIIRIVLLNWAEVTGGPNGIAGIPRPTFFGLPLTASAPEGKVTFHEFFGLTFSPDHRVTYLYYLILALALATLWLTERLRRLPVGWAWEALREDEIAAQAVGLNPTAVKLSAFAIGATLGGLAGCFFAARQGFISPESFTFTESAIILAIVVLGGMGSQIGVVLAAAVLVGLPELGREFTEFRMLVFGLAMVLIMIWRPRGLLAVRTPSVLAPSDPARPSPA